MSVCHGSNALIWLFFFDVQGAYTGSHPTQMVKLFPRLWGTSIGKQRCLFNGFQQGLGGLRKPVESRLGFVLPLGSEGSFANGKHPPPVLADPLLMDRIVC